MLTARWAEGRHVEKLLAALDGCRRSPARSTSASSSRSRRRATSSSAPACLRGEIALGAAGGEGFGFDPVFVPDGETRTVAELGDAWKAKHSHRALAARALQEELGRRDAPLGVGDWRRRSRQLGGDAHVMRRLFAAMYDTVGKGSEEAGMRDERRQLLAASRRG